MNHEELMRQVAKECGIDFERFVVGPQIHDEIVIHLVGGTEDEWKRIGVAMNQIFVAKLKKRVGEFEP